MSDLVLKTYVKYQEAESMWNTSLYVDFTISTPDYLKTSYKPWLKLSENPRMLLKCISYGRDWCNSTFRLVLVVQMHHIDHYVWKMAFLLFLHKLSKKFAQE